jgi:hypothetical protein
MHAAHNCIDAGVQKRASRRDKGKDLKEPLPELAHGEHLVGRLPMQKKRLTEEGEKSMSKDEDGDCEGWSFFWHLKGATGESPPIPKCSLCPQ